MCPSRRPGPRVLSTGPSTTVAPVSCHGEFARAAWRAWVAAASAASVVPPGTRRTRVVSEKPGAGVSPVVAGVRRRDLQRKPDVRRVRLGTREAWRHHADDRVRHLSEGECGAERFAGAAEAPLPVPVADHRDRFGRRVVIRGDDGPPDSRAGAEQGEKLARDPGHLQFLGTLAAAVLHGPRPRVAADGAEAVGVRSQGAEIDPVRSPRACTSGPRDPRPRYRRTAPAATPGESLAGPRCVEAPGETAGTAARTSRR